MSITFAGIDFLCYNSIYVTYADNILYYTQSFLLSNGERVYNLFLCPVKEVNLIPV